MAKRDGVINPQNQNVNFYTDNFDALKTQRINQSLL